MGRLAQQRSRALGELRLAQTLRRLPRENGARVVARDSGQGETLGDLALGRIVIGRRPPHPVLGRVEELFMIETLELHANDEAFPERTERQPVDGVVEQVEGAHGDVPGDLLGIELRRKQGRDMDKVTIDAWPRQHSGNAVGQSVEPLGEDEPFDREKIAYRRPIRAIVRLPAKGPRVILQPRKPVRRASAVDVDGVLLMARRAEGVPVDGATAVVKEEIRLPFVQKQRRHGIPDPIGRGSRQPARHGRDTMQQAPQCLLVRTCRIHAAVRKRPALALRHGGQWIEHPALSGRPGGEPLEMFAACPRGGVQICFQPRDLAGGVGRSAGDAVQSRQLLESLGADRPERFERRRAIPCFSAVDLLIDAVVEHGDLADALGHVARDFLDDGDVLRFRNTVSAQNRERAAGSFDPRRDSLREGFEPRRVGMLP